VEYALIILAMAIAMLVILAFIGQIVFVDMYSKIASAFPTPR
jgi:Flp pilus assembly pilin Flp